MTLHDGSRTDSDRESPGYVVGVDWGSSRLRIYLIDRELNVVEEDGSSAGILFGREGVANHEISDRIESLRAGRTVSAVVISGMAGSASGLIHTPYAIVPISMRSLTEASVSVGKFAGAPTWVLAGGMGKRDPVTGIADVMRGEEFEVLSALALNNIDRPAMIVCPGTHSKWVEVEGMRIQDLTTFVTGEVFAYLRDSSSLAPLMTGPGGLDGFDEGLELAKGSKSLLNGVFQIRAGVLQGAIAPRAIAGMASGLVIGIEILDATDLGLQQKELFLLGGSELSRRYESALAMFGLNFSVLQSRVGWNYGQMASALLSERGVKRHG